MVELLVFFFQLLINKTDMFLMFLSGTSRIWLHYNPSLVSTVRPTASSALKKFDTAHEMRKSRISIEDRVGLMERWLYRFNLLLVTCLQSL